MRYENAPFIPVSLLTVSLPPFGTPEASRWLKYVLQKPSVMQAYQRANSLSTSFPSINGTFSFMAYIIEVKIDFLLTYFKKVVIIISCKHSYIITCNGERWLSLAIFFYVKTQGGVTRFELLLPLLQLPFTDSPRYISQYKFSHCHPQTLLIQVVGHLLHQKVQVDLL